MQNVAGHIRNISRSGFSSWPVLHFEGVYLEPQLRLLPGAETALGRGGTHPLVFQYCVQRSPGSKRTTSKPSARLSERLGIP